MGAASLPQLFPKMAHGGPIFGNSSAKRPIDVGRGDDCDYGASEASSPKRAKACG